MIEAAWDAGRCPIGVGHDVIELFPIKLSSLKKREGSHYVCTGECERILDRAVNVRLGRQVDDSVNLLILHQLVESLEIADVHLHELVVRLVLYILEVGEVTCIGKLVEVDDVVLRILVDKKAYHMAADETGTAGYDYITFHFTRERRY